MMPFVGLFFLILASVLSFCGVVSYFIKSDVQVMRLQNKVSVLQSVAMLGAFLQLMYLCGTLDFSVAYVAAHTHTALPMVYRLAATWGGHEGSLLLWLLFLALWIFGFSKSQSTEAAFKKDMFCILQGIFLIFSLFVIFTSNPFMRLIPLSPVEGKDLNPLLQDPGLIFHPPMLYAGYVGAAIPFAFAIAALKNKTWTADIAKAVRPWCLLAWGFLTAGVTLGSFWAYYELGWGGFWFWDPVENASVMPWFCLTALIHALIVSEKREMLKRLCLLLAIFSFLFSILGTFLVRSGVLVSVHAFASDPTRGQVILLMLFAFSVLSLLVYLWRVPMIREVPLQNYAAKEGLMALGAFILFTIAGIVVLGTLYPIVLEMAFHEKISVGAPYFNALIMPLGLVILVLASLAPTVNWMRFSAPIKRHAITVALAGVATVLLALYFKQMGFYFVAGIWAALWLTEITLMRVYDRMRSSKAFSLPFMGMIVGHVGLAVLALGLSLTTALSVVRETHLAIGESAELAGVKFTLQDVKQTEGPNYIADEGQVWVTENHDQFALLPQKRKYQSGMQTYTETAISAGFSRDILVALGEQLEGKRWSLRLQIRPFVRMIWLGGILIAMAGVMSALSGRYRKQGAI